MAESSKESSELQEEVIEGVTVYRITVANDDKTDYQGDPDQKALQRMRQSGWWGDQSRVSPADGLRPEYLSAVLQNKCGRSHSELKSPGVYMYLKKGNNMIYIGSAIGNETLLDRQMRHLTAAAYTDMDQLDMFDRQLRQQYAQDNWDFYAIPMSSGNPEKIHDKEKELITQYNAIKHGYNS